MAQQVFARIAGTGSYLPDNIVTNADLEKRVDTTDAWITERTGIRQRHIALPGQTTGDLAFEASKRALEAAGVAASEIDLLIVGTTTPDVIFPSTACLLQNRLGANGCPAFDVNAACTGFVYALGIANNFIRAGAAKTALVVGAETLSRMIDWTDRGTCVLFGDGAGAVVLEPGEGDGTTADRGLLGFALRADGTKQDLLYVDGGVSTNGQIGHLRMQGNQVFRHAVVNISEAIVGATEAAGVAIPEIDWFVPHQANQRIIRGVGERLGLDENKVVSTVALHANTSAASIPLALDHGVRSGQVKPGQTLLLEGVGGGFTWGAVLLVL